MNCDVCGKPLGNNYSERGPSPAGPVRICGDCMGSVYSMPGDPNAGAFGPPPGTTWRGQEQSENDRA